MQTWPLTFREGNIAIIFENRVLRKICGPKREDERAGWTKLDECGTMTCIHHQILFE